MHVRFATSGSSKCQGLSRGYPPAFRKLTGAFNLDMCFPCRPLSLSFDILLFRALAELGGITVVFDPQHFGIPCRLTVFAFSMEAYSSTSGC